MVLRNGFYTVGNSDISETQAGFRVRLNAENFVYKAHFQNNPITPGVCLVQMAVELFGVVKSAAVKDADFRIDTLKNVKFIAPLSPMKFPEVTFTLEFTENAIEETGGWQLKVLISENETVFAKMSMLLK